ncbi:MAG: recombination protein RecR [Clostridia bacterium]|nr:recombination protein RecR [Clostridia bacterium]
MLGFTPALERLVEKFRLLPGVGYKSAVRMAFNVLEMTEDDARGFAQAILDAKEKIGRCRICCDISETEVCSVCSDPARDTGVICVVESPKDVLAIERVNHFHGLYHVLWGLLDPMDGIGPDEICVKELLARLGKGDVHEVIIATNPSIEGEATAMYLSRLLKPFGVKTTRLAYGLPAGGELEYADDLTLFKALEGRLEI